MSLAIETRLFLVNGAADSSSRFFVVQDRISDTTPYFLSFRNGEEKGFAWYFKLHYRPTVYFASRLLKSEAAAEDIVADSFVKLFEKRNSIQSEATLKGFLFTTVKNACLDRLEQMKTRSAHHQKFMTGDPETEVKTAEKELIRAETLGILLDAIEQLPRETRRVLKLFYLEELSYDQIAEKLNRSKHTVRKQKQNALGYLRGKLKS